MINRIEDWYSDHMPLRGHWITDDLPYILTGWVRKVCRKEAP